MPRKNWRLLVRDLSFYLTGDADVAAADWARDPWIYPLDWSFQLQHENDYFTPRDDDGIPLRVFPAPIGARYLPSRIAAFGIAHWNQWVTRRDAHSRGEFLRMADWFVTRGDDGRYFHDLPIAGKTAPWLSCIAQGEAASVLVRAHRLTGEARYGDAARRAAHWLLVTEADGGLQSRLPDGGPFLEEYPGTEYRHVLNGCLYAAVGLSDVCRHADGDERCVPLQEFLRELMDAIGRNIGAWDIDGWSSYDFASDVRRARNLNTMTYQSLQVILLRYLADFSGDTRLRQMAERWGGSTERLSSRLNALRAKMVYRMAAGW